MDQSSADVEVLQSFIDTLERLCTRNRILEEHNERERVRNETELKDISMMKAQLELLLQEEAMLGKETKSVEERIVLYEESVISQLKSELKSKDEGLKAKKEEHRKILEHHERIWKKYEIEYSKLPRVAERNAVKNKLDLLRSELAIKKREIGEKEMQVKIVQENKARRLINLKEELVEWIKIKQKEEAANAELLLKIREMEDRIAEKEAKKLSDTIVPDDQPKRIFKIPTFDDLADVIKIGAQYSFEARQNKKQSQGTHFDPPAACVGSVTNKCQGQSLLHPGVQQVQLFHENNEVESGGVKELEVHASIIPTSICSVDSDEPAQAAPTLIPELPQIDVRSVCTPGNKKREVVLITDDIAAKIKDCTQQNKRCEISSISDTSSAAQNVDSSVTEKCSESQSIIDKNNENVQEELSSLLMESETNKNQDEPLKENDGSQNSVDIFENDNSEELSGPNFNDYNTEFREDMYDDLRSPPPFDVVMSPAHATFSSPLSFEEENQTDQQENKGDSVSTSAPFGGFGFFKSTPNIFGGQPNSSDGSKGQDKPNSSFPFFF